MKFSQVRQTREVVFYDVREYLELKRLLGRELLHEQSFHILILG